MSAINELTSHFFNQSLLMLVNKNTTGLCIFMLVHSVLILTNTTFDFHNVRLNVEFNLN